MRFLISILVLTTFFSAFKTVNGQSKKFFTHSYNRVQIVGHGTGNVQVANTVLNIDISTNSLTVQSNQKRLRRFKVLSIENVGCQNHIKVISEEDNTPVMFVLDECNQILLWLLTTESYFVYWQKD